MISKILDRYNKWQNRCRSCEVDGIHKSLIGHYKNIKEISRIKTVIEYKCETCEILWVLADNAQFINKVVRNELYAKWKSRSWIPTISQIEILNQIIGAPDYYEKDVYFPCTIRLPNGLRVQKAILVATTGDCFGKFPIDHNVTILDESHGISPSDHALPADVRAATMVAREKSMGYAPVNVKDASGNRYTLSNQMHFFEKNGARATDVILDDSPYHGKNIVHPDWAEMYLICDMFECKTAKPKAIHTAARPSSRREAAPRRGRRGFEG